MYRGISVFTYIFSRISIADGIYSDLVLRHRHLFMPLAYAYVFRTRPVLSLVLGTSLCLYIQHSCILCSSAAIICTRQLSCTSKLACNKAYALLSKQSTALHICKYILAYYKLVYTSLIYVCFTNIYAYILRI